MLVFLNNNEYDYIWTNEKFSHLAQKYFDDDGGIMRIAFFLGIFACATEEKVTEPSNEGEITLDNDGDGFTVEEDCDDDDANVSPSAEEFCDGIDNNCDGVVDEDVTSTFYADSDDDGLPDGQDYLRCPYRRHLGQRRATLLGQKEARRARGWSRPFSGLGGAPPHEGCARLRARKRGPRFWSPLQSATA